MRGCGVRDREQIGMCSCIPAEAECEMAPGRPIRVTVDTRPKKLVLYSTESALRAAAEE